MRASAKLALLWLGLAAPAGLLGCPGHGLRGSGRGNGGSGAVDPVPEPPARAPGCPTCYRWRRCASAPAAS